MLNDMLITNADPSSWMHTLREAETKIAREQLLLGTLVESADHLTMDQLNSKLRLISMVWG